MVGRSKALKGSFIVRLEENYVSDIIVKPVVVERTGRRGGWMEFLKCLLVHQKYCKEEDRLDLSRLIFNP